jgi:eukaryotic-like serine/threonine-protein kinase
MSKERLHRAREIFLACVKRDSTHERAEFIERECGSDDALQSAVVNLLEAHEVNGGFLEKPFDGSFVDDNGELATTLGMSTVTEQPGSRIGPYKLLQQIGEGGFGVVYMAQQTQPVRRKVALKIVKAGMDTKEVIARFEAERQALALMDHPNIAKVLDAGTTSSGRPYFVMELVHGVPITEFCDESKLTTPERLELFVDVCRAVQHAHQKGIIHRDLKPSNVLITMNDDRPMPKVIDFGISKALSQQLTEKTLFTAFGQMVGTPLYMSPEQAQFSTDDVDTRSDVYSLGVLMYELLTGSTPFDKETLQNSGVDEMRRLIREVDPPRPSARVSTLHVEVLSTVSDRRKVDPRKLGHFLRGELDWIVMKALEKDCNRRYESASAFAADVERYLADEAVQACPPSVGYQLRKLFVRHRALLITALLVLMAVVVGAGFSVRYAIQADEARRLADDRLGIANTEQANTKRAVARFQNLLYAADMKLASDAIAGNDSPRALELLERHAPAANAVDLQGFEWHFYKKQVTQRPGVSLDQEAWVNDVELSPDGKWLAVGTNAGMVRVYEATTWKLHQSIDTAGQQVNGVAWSPEGRQLAAACQDGTLFLWDLDSGKRHKKIRAHVGGANDVAFSPDGRSLYSCGDDDLARKWNFETGEEQGVYKKHRRVVERLALSPDGKILATASSDRTIALWDTQTARCLHHIESHRNRVVCVTFSHNGRLVAAGDIDGQVSLIDARTGKERQLSPQLDGVEALTFFQGGKWLATADRAGAIQLHVVPDELLSEFQDSPPRSEPLRWIAHQGRALALVTTRDGNSLISGGRDGAVRVWTPELNALRWCAYSGTSFSDFTFGPDNRLYLTGRCLSVWDLERRRLVESFAFAESTWRVTACSADGRFLAAARPGRLVLFDAHSHKVLREWPLDENLDLHRCAISPDGKLIAVAGYSEKTVLVFSRDGSKKVREYPAKQCRCLAFSTDGRWLAAGHMNDLRLFDLRGSGEVRNLRGHSNALSGVCFSPDGKLFATVGDDRLLKIWTLADGKERFSIVAHRDGVEAVAFTPDGRTIATASDDGQIKLWHTATGQPLGALPKETGNIWKLRFSSDGLRLAALVKKTKLVVYDASTSSLTETERPSSTAAADFQGLGDLPGGSFVSTANGMSSNGKYVAGHSRTRKGFEAFRWSWDDGLVAYSLPNSKNCQANAVSDDGRVLCGSGNSPRRGWCAQIRFAPRESGAIAPAWSNAVATSSDRAITIGNLWAKNRWRAFYYQAGKTMFLPRPPKYQHVQVVAVTPDRKNILGRVFNIVHVSAYRTLLVSQHIKNAQPIIWKDGKPEFVPGFDGSRNWWPCDISDDGSVIVGVCWPFGYNFFSPVDHASGVAFRWKSGRVTFLGSLPNYQHSRAFTVSGDGRIVGGTCYHSAESGISDTGFVWDIRHGLRSLREVLAAADANISGWEIHEAVGISRDGRTIAGNGVNPQGNEEAWIARLPRDIVGGTTTHRQPPVLLPHKRKADFTKVASRRNTRPVRAVKRLPAKVAAP